MPLHSAFGLDLPDFFSYTWNGTEPPGVYLLFVAAVVPGGFADGILDPGDVLTLDTVSFQFVP